MASPQAAKRLLTAEEFYELPEPDEGGRMELVNGGVVVDMVVSHPHGEFAAAIIEFLRAFARQYQLGRVSTEVGFLIRRNPDTVRGPDVAFIATQDIPAGGIPRTGAVPFPPTLAVEVVSPHDLDAEIDAKVQEYLAAGVKRVWVVRPRTRSVTVHRPDHTARILVGSALLTSDDAAFATPGFQLPLEEIFGAAD